MKHLHTGLMLASIVVASACSSAAHEGTAPDSAPLDVGVASAALADIPSTFEAGGVVRARATAVLASRVLAPITGIRVRAGDRVRRGAVLVTLDAREIRSAHARAEAGAASAQEMTRAADADLLAAESALVLARASHDRVTALHARRSATPQELDQAVAGLAAAASARTAAQARQAAAVASRDAAKAAAETAAIGATYATLTAPFDGVVSERHADPGSMAVPGAAILTIEDTTSARFEAELDAARAARVSIGQAATIAVDAAPSGAPMDGRVVSVTRIDPRSHTFLVKIDLPAGQALHSGMYGRVRFRAGDRRALTVPASALVRRGQLRFVYRVDQDRARLRPVSAGPPVGTDVEVLAGLNAGDVVVVDPPAALGDGARVAGSRR